MPDSVLERYALAYIKENGSDKNVQRFLQSQRIRNATNWYDKDFKNAYGEFKLSNRFCRIYKP
nr:hypothetical protein [Rickettsia endosymbiont of Ceutorhynchus assimilis]